MASGQNGGLWRLVGLEDHTGADKHAGDHGPDYGGDDGDHGGEHGGDHGCDHVGDHGGDHGGDGDNADVIRFSHLLFRYKISIDIRMLYKEIQKLELQREYREYASGIVQLSTFSF